MKQIFFEKIREYGMEKCEKRMADYADELLKVNEYMNLTRITEDEEVAIKHFVDSAHPDILALIPENAKVIDIGTGGGFPGVPIKLARQDVSMSFLESVGKKLEFVKSTCEKQGIQGEFYNLRAEEADELFGKYDVVVSRAVASLPVLLELCSAFVKTGGRLLAYKGVIADKELSEAKNAIKTLGLELEKTASISVEGAEHCVLVFKKIAKTPKGYPRKYAQIKKRPL